MARNKVPACNQQMHVTCLIQALKVQRVVQKCIGGGLEGWGIGGALGMDVRLGVNLRSVPLDCNASSVQTWATHAIHACAV